MQAMLTLRPASYPGMQKETERDRRREHATHVLVQVQVQHHTLIKISRCGLPVACLYRKVLTAPCMHDLCALGTGAYPRHVKCCAYAWQMSIDCLIHVYILISTHSLWYIWLYVVFRSVYHKRSVSPWKSQVHPNRTLFSVVVEITSSNHDVPYVASSITQQPYQTCTLSY